MDQKLVFLVKKSVLEGKVEEEAVLQHICEQHEEYKRKHKDILRNSIQEVLRIMAPNIIASADAVACELDESGVQEKQAQLHIRTEAVADEAVSSNLINQSLSSHYRRLTDSKKRTADIQETNGKHAKRTRKVKETENIEKADTFLVHPSSRFICPRPSARFSDLGGLGKVTRALIELTRLPLLFPDIYTALGAVPPRGVLLHGPPGCGKTKLAHSLAGELGVVFLRASAPELVGGTSGDSERLIRELFNSAQRHAPSIVFLDELDAIAGKRDASQRGMEKRIVAQLLTCLDELEHSYDKATAMHGTADGADELQSAQEQPKPKPVVVIAATTRPDALDPALRRAGRLDREICLGVPDATARAEILQVLMSRMKIHEDVDLRNLAKNTPGYVGADLLTLTREAAVQAVSRIFGEREQESATISTVEVEKLFSNEALEALRVTMADFEGALGKVQPSAKREGFTTVADVSWDDIGALRNVREELSLMVLEPIAFPERFQRLGLTVPAGVLLYGPPGCGKTLLAKAVANQSAANFISIKGPELLDKYVGESERAVRQVFQRARASAPCVIFFDEIDALCPRRGGADSGGAVAERVVNQLLTEMDGLEARKDVFVIAATNRPELVDPAMLRPGRIDKLLYVPLPSPEDRVSILRAVMKKVAVSVHVDLEAVGKDPRADGFSGADLSALVREAGLCVMRKLTRKYSSVSSTTTQQQSLSLPHPQSSVMVWEDSQLCITPEEFDEAFSRVKPSVSAQERRAYERIAGKLSRNHIGEKYENVPQIV